jgi:cellulose synthase/poly-beta-1,6-N-acetylglucosamine synthase-like glycosyltransferase
MPRENDIEPFGDATPLSSSGRTEGSRPRWRFRWWMPSLAAFALCGVLFAHLAGTDGGTGWFQPRSAGWWAVTTVLHLPYLVILLFVVGGLVERLGYFRHGRAPEPAGRLPAEYPTVCVQLPMFNEHAVARRTIEAACALEWPADRFSVQVLDDSTEEDTRKLVEAVCAEVRDSTGVDCRVLHRDERRGYKAGALEDARKETDAEFLAIFDSDFVPPRDFLMRTIPHFYSEDGAPDEQLALVQAQWGHLNHDESSLTRAQSLWVDDHHTLQMSWRSAMWRFVNFTGTAGVWRASAIEAAGGWRAASLVEDCELSFRVLFAGYRTKFVKEIVVPAELPATYTAYKAQQRRWTQGWAQLQRMHLATLLFRFQSSWLRRVHLLHHMCVSWQWPAWAIWITLLPVLIHTGHWFGSLGIALGVLLYLLPPALWALVTATVASLQTRHTYPGELTPSTFLGRVGRIVPHTVVNAGMLPHQLSAFAEGLFGPLHGEFERTPKTASVTPTSSEARAADHPRVIEHAESAKPTGGVKIHWPYALTEAAYVLYQGAWAVLFAAGGLVFPAVGAAFLGGCVLYVGFFYGDHAGKVCFVVERGRLRLFGPWPAGYGVAGKERRQGDAPAGASSPRTRTTPPRPPGRPQVSHDTN